MKSKIIKRYRLEFYNHANKVVAQIDSSSWDMLKAVFDAQSQYFYKVRFMTKHPENNKWERGNVKLIKQG